MIKRQIKSLLCNSTHWPYLGLVAASHVFEGRGAGLLIYPLGLGFADLEDAPRTAPAHAPGGTFYHEDHGSDYHQRGQEPERL
jgi:hypothetical protein